MLRGFFILSGQGLLRYVLRSKTAGGAKKKAE